VLLWGSRMLQRMSPLGWIAGGLVLALSVPAVRKRLMSVATAATAGIMSATNNTNEMKNNGTGEISIQDAGL